MTISSLDAAGQLEPLATYLFSRRDAMLANWRTACESDPNLRSGAGLTGEEFTNKVPFMLNELQRSLEGQPQETEVSLLAAEHGLHRWQQGYTLHELSTEMRHLNNSLLGELRLGWKVCPFTDRNLIATAYEYIATFSNQISVGSVEQYATLQRAATSNRIEALEKTLTQLNEMSQQRSDLLHQSSHDLRGSFGIIQGAASLLELTSDSEEERKHFLAMLQRNLANCCNLVTQLIEVARLEAGQETLHIQSFNAGQLLTSLIADYQPLAQERGLLLKADGPAHLAVECDSLHLQRIIQNLVLNALKHTVTGFVSVSWSRENDYQWMICVQDSGPGLPTVTTTGLLHSVLSQSPESIMGFGLPKADSQQATNTQIVGSAFVHKGEGIGLSIVKGLCELLRANLEIESRPGAGTLFRIRQSIHWHS